MKRTPSPFRIIRVDYFASLGILVPGDWQSFVQMVEMNVVVPR